MSIEILFNENEDQAALYCNTTDWAFGPVFDGKGDFNAKETAQYFLKWLVERRETRDARMIPNDELEKYRNEFTAFMNAEPVQCEECEKLVAKDKAVHCGNECTIPDVSDHIGVVWCSDDCREEAHP